MTAFTNWNNLVLVPFVVFHTCIHVLAPVRPIVVLFMWSFTQIKHKTMGIRLDAHAPLDGRETKDASGIYDVDEMKNTTVTRQDDGLRYRRDQERDSTDTRDEKKEE